MPKIKLNKKIVIPVIIILIIILLIALYLCSLRGFNDSKTVTFEVQSGASKIDIVEDLKSAGLIRSKTATLIHLVLNKNLTLQAGTYRISRNMSTQAIIDKINRGDIKVDTVTVTFVEGDNINDYIELISKNFNVTESEVKAVFENEKFTKSLVEKYDFLTESVLNDNIYYALEGYLFPDTYEFLENSSIEDVIIRILNNTQIKLNSLEIDSEYSVHEILSMASIVELEAVTESDRRKVAQVIYKRLEIGKGLGTDVTTYYAAHKEMGVDVLTMNDLLSNNPYNTSEMNTSMTGKLPVGPICNPSLESIKAVLNPSDTDYVYFVANTCTGEVFFNVSDVDHVKKSQELQSICATN